MGEGCWNGIRDGLQGSESERERRVVRKMRGATAKMAKPEPGSNYQPPIEEQRTGEGYASQKQHWISRGLFGRRNEGC